MSREHAAALVVLMAAATGVMSASAGGTHSRSGAKGLVGSWIPKVNRGPSLPPIRSLQNYNRGRGINETFNGGGTVRSASVGVWQRTGRRTYAATMVFFGYNPTTGAYIGTTKLRRKIEVAADGQSFTAVSVPEFRDETGTWSPAATSGGTPRWPSASTSHRFPARSVQASIVRRKGPTPRGLSGLSCRASGTRAAGTACRHRARRGLEAARTDPAV